MPKILYFDIETSYNLCRVWQCGYKINVGPETIHTERQIICICWKWKGSKKKYSLDWGLNTQNDADLLKAFSKELAQADVVVGQNSDKFDLRILTGRLAYHNLPPINNLVTLDTLKLAKRGMNLNSYKLDYMSKFLGGQGKKKMDLQDWIDIIEDEDPKALKKMIKYCMQDVDELEYVHNRIQPYANTTVHRGVLRGHDRTTSCPNCGFGTSQKRGVMVTASGVKKQRLQCTSCGKWFKGETIK